MEIKLFLYLCFIYGAQFILKCQSEKLIDGLKVDNCIFNCVSYWGTLSCTADCDGPSLINDKFNINDIIEQIDPLTDISDITSLIISSNNINGFNNNYFCSLNKYKIENLNLENNKLNDSSRIGLGDINKCEDDNSTCQYAIIYLYLNGNQLKILKNNTFCYMNNVEKLYLTNCSLNIIEENAFKFKNRLQVLYLDENQLTEIPNLGHLISLQYLYINKNSLTSIKNSDLVNCKELGLLDLSFNKISHIEDNVFDQLTNLYSLFLNNNKLTTISPTFGKLSVYELKLDNNLLTEINMLDFSINLKYLDAKQNLITQVSANLSNLHIKEIKLPFNKIKSLDIIELPMTLEVINVQHNNIKHFSVEYVEPNRLRDIFLTDNNIQIVPNDGFDARNYHIMNNPLVCSCENSWLFSDSEKMNEINRTPCSSINNYNPSHQSILDVNMLCESNFNDSNRCHVKHSNESQFQCQFQCINPCYCYTTSDFSIAHYYCSNRQLQVIPQWTNSGQLHENSEVIIWLDGNNFSLITNVSFIDYSNVTQLYLNNSLIEEIHHFALANMTKLKLLDLSHNQLTTIEENTFNQLIHLEKLLLSNNKLNQLPDNSFDSLKSIQLLHLHSNKLINYPVWKLEKISITELTINNNPWNCNCIFINSIHTFLKTNWRIVPNINEINCVDGNKIFPASYYYSSKCFSPIQNCSIKCQLGKGLSEIDKVSININCNDSNSFTHTNYDIDDIIKANCVYNYSFINEIEIEQSSIVELKTNFFCPIDFYNAKSLSIINNQLNDSSKLGFGDSSNCSSMSNCKFQTLETLILNGNPLKALKNNTFCHLTKLKYLHVSNCSLETIEADAFYNLAKLEFLNLNDNRLNKIPCMLNLNSLLQLNITNNIINSIENMELYQILESIDLSFNNIQTIKKNSYDTVRHLNFLNLSHNQITDLNKSYIFLSRVLTLDLSHNQLKEIDYSNIPKGLLTLLLRGNLITDLRLNSFYNSLELTFIDLSRNKLQNVSGTNLSPNLEVIDLSYNEIKKLEISKSNVKNLKDINLTNNSLSILIETNLDADIFNLTNNPIGCNCENSWIIKHPKWNKMVGQPCETVTTFNPANHTTLTANMFCESTYQNSNRCVIEHPIEPHFECQFKCPFPFYCYTTDDFSIAQYYCLNKKLKIVPQLLNSGQLNSESELLVWLDGNNFNKIKNENFTNYDNVTQLYLSNCNITSIDSLTFANMTNLKFLDLSDNKLTSIKEGTFNQLINLQKLILSHNKIAYLPDDIFNDTISMQSLQLHYNKLTNYSFENLRNRPILREITLHNNSWTCNCSFIIEFQYYLIHNSYSIQNLNIYCTHENGSLANSPVIQYNTSYCTDQLQTIDNTWPIVIGIITPLCLFAIAYVVIRCIKARASAKRVQQIESAYSLMQNTGTSIETDGKVFDVFISYHNDDSYFVATEIVPKLENVENPYHVCVHERNFLGGGSIEDTIIEAIKKSTRIIVILTENYIKSEWCMYEFVIAHSVMIEDQCPRVVLIIKDELPSEINPNLQIYLNTNTYIEWTDSKFWQRLYFALSSNKLPMEQTLQPMNFLMSTRFLTPDD
ncbi:TOLL-like receptor [Chamberlinius hualienensis]